MSAHPTKTAVQKQFGASSEAYATSEVHARGESLSLLVRLLPLKPSDVVLDIATGAGHTAIAIASKCAQIVATDITQEMLDTARRLADEQGISNISFQFADAEKLPFDDNRFDAVTCRLAFHHFPNPVSALAEFHRVLKPGGLVGFTDNFSVEDPDDALFYNHFEQLRDPSHVCVYPLTRLRRFFTDTQLEIVDQHYLCKEFEFHQWADRQNVSETEKRTLLELAGNVPNGLLDSFRPRFANDTFYFTLWETVIVAKRIDH